MQRKYDTNDLDIPKDDIECWERYPKHHWVYDLSRLLDAQHIKWSPYESEELQHRELNMKLESARLFVRQPGFIYTKTPTGLHLYNEVYLAKGETKLIRHIDPDTLQELPTLVGEVELRLNAFMTLYFTKFTGVVQLETYGNEIFGIKLRPYSDSILITNSEIIKLVKKIYKRTDQVLSGLADRSLHETLAS